MRQRNIRIQIRLNEIEFEKLKDDVSRSKLTISEYIRKLILNEQIKEKPGIEFLKVMTQLSRGGVTLKQIYQKANKDNMIDKDLYKKCADDLNKFSREVKEKFL